MCIRDSSKTARSDSKTIDFFKQFFLHLSDIRNFRMLSLSLIHIYDFTPVIGPTFGSSLLAVGSLTSGVSNSHGVTGGVYKTCLLYTSRCV